MGEYTMAQFKALRETAGLSVADVAGALGVEVRAVHRWERPEADYSPFDGAWDYIERMAERHDDCVEKMVNAAMKQVPRTAGMAVALPYYASQGQYEKSGHKGSYGFANSVSREAASRLSRYGYDVSFAYPGEI